MVHDKIDKPSCFAEKLVQNSLEERADIHLEHYGLEVDVQAFQCLSQFGRFFTENLTI